MDEFIGCCSSCLFLLKEHIVYAVIIVITVVFFYRNDGRKGKSIFLRDCFSVVRTSKRCFRLIYVDCRSSAVFYHSFSKSSDMADFMENVFRYGFDSSEWSHPP